MPLIFKRLLCTYDHSEAGREDPGTDGDARAKSGTAQRAKVKLEEDKSRRSWKLEVSTSPPSLIHLKSTFSLLPPLALGGLIQSLCLFLRHVRTHARSSFPSR